MHIFSTFVKISRKKNYDQIPFFTFSKMAKYLFFELGKSLKLPEMQFHENILFDFSRGFKFSGPLCLAKTASQY